MATRHAVLCATLLFAICVVGAKARPRVDETLPSNYVPSGKMTFRLYCASCHGIDAKGQGPFCFHAESTTTRSHHARQTP